MDEPDGTLTASAVATHHTATSDKSWNGPQNEGRLPSGNDATEAKLKPAYAWQNPDKDAATKAAYSLIHHEVDGNGKIGAANTKACSSAIGVLNGARGGANIPGGDRQATYNHLAGHLKDSGVSSDDLPPLKSSEMAAHLAAAHGKVSGVHSHSHPSYSSQGGDKTHEHPHRHAGDANHGHDHGAKMPGTAADGTPWGAAEHELAGPASMVAAGTTADDESGRVEPGWLTDARTLVASGAHTSLVAASMQVLGSPWGIEQSGDAWDVLDTDGSIGTFDTYGDAMWAVRERAFAEGQQRPVLAESWRSEMAYEDVETGDGRYIAPGAIQYRDCPMPLMLQTVTDIGHFGAVLAGTILQAGTTGGTALGSGEFDDSDAGRQFLQIIEARDRFGVSIDGVSPVEYEFECTQRDDEDGSCLDGRLRFNIITIGGVTGTPFPAFKDAYIALEQRAQTASGETEDEPCDDCDDEARAKAEAKAASGHVAVGKEEPRPVGKDDPTAFTAAGPAALPAPADWFADPRFHMGDGRLVPQPPDGRRLACPLTVTADGRVFGHMAGWFSCHTGIVDHCETAPRSKSGYAAFLLRPVMTADGQVVRVGNITMKCGHASTDPSRPLSAEQVRAHYDGGPQAKRAAIVACGEDEFGIWFAGCVDPDLTAEEVRYFSSLNVSGDWREVWRGRGLDLVACLAGVIVPGFPVASALAAAGFEFAADYQLPAEPVAMWDGDRQVALVAAGVVRRPLPWESALAAQDRRIELLEGRVASAERVTSELRADAAGRKASRVAAIGRPLDLVEPAGNGSS